MRPGGRDADGRPDGRLPGYLEIRSPAAFWVTRPECAGAIASGRIDPLLAGPARQRQRPGGGRGPLWSLDLDGQPAIAKRSVHGGLLGPLLGGLYLGSGRARAQARAAEHLGRAGVPTSRVLAVGWRTVLGPLTAQAIISRALPGARTLYEVAGEELPRRRRRALLEESARLVRAMHDAGFQHGDLNVTNLVLGKTSSGERLHVIDLDRGRVLARLGAPQRSANLARLLRSYDKWIAPRVPLSGREEVLFLKRYCGAERGLFDDLRIRLRRHRAWLGLRRRIRGRLPRRRGGARTVDPVP